MRHLISVFLLSVVASCNVKKKEKILNYGKIENNIYKNDFFDVQVTIPEGWAVQNQEQMEKLVDESTDKIRSGNEDIAKQIDLSQQQSVYLLTVFRNDPSVETESFNYSFLMMAEKLPLSNIKTGERRVT